MAEVITPAPGQTIITTDLRDHRHHGEGHHFPYTRVDADFIALAAQSERLGIQGAAHAARTNELVQAGACRTDQIVQAGFGDTSDRICASTKDVTGALSTGFTAAALAACKTSDEVAAVYASLQKQVSDAATATVVGFKDAQATAYQIEGRQALDAAKNVAALGLQATNNFNLLTVQGTENTYKILLDSQKNAAAAQLEAEKNAAKISRELAECCCELRTQAAANLAAITATSVAGTQAILSKMCDDKNADLRAQLVATQRLIPVTIPVGAG
jgi:hypothetical protein